MNLLDENFPKDQLPRLREWRIPCRLIGRDIARVGANDSDIVPLLHRRRGVTFFTLDLDFFNMRRFLKHPRFNTQARRMGIVARVRHRGIDFWQHNRAALQRVRWI